jgi:iron complex outermembrane recepter protein
VPKHNLNLVLEYEHKIIEILTGFIKGSFISVSDLYADDANSEKTDGYNILNGAMGIEMSISGFNFLLIGGINNIFDLKYVGFVNINSASKEFYELGEPRNFFGGLNISYGF